MQERKYGELVKKLSFINGHGGANARELTAASGDQLAGFNFNFLVGIYD
jgi:hypothetical protein